MQTQAQKSRIAAYRRARPNPESLSDTQQKPTEEYIGGSHPVPMLRGGRGGFGGSTGPQQQQQGGFGASYAAGTRSSASPPAPAGGYAQQQGYGAGGRPAAPDVLLGGTPAAQRRGPQQGQGFVPSSVATVDPSSSGALGATSPLVAGATPYQPAAGGGGNLQGVPADLGQYILQLEAQNNELRAALAQAPAAGRSGSFSGERTEDEKRIFLNDVLSQVETVIQAHKNKTAAEIQKYKSEAENATLALRNLRAAIQQEGMDLTLAPAMVSFSRRSALTAGGAASSGKYTLGKAGDTTLQAGAGVSDAIRGQRLQMPPESEQLLEAISEDYLRKLLAVSTSDEVPSVVKETTRASFEAIIAHFTEQLCTSFEESDSVISTLKSEVKSLQDDMRVQQTAGETQKIQLVQQAEQETQALRDQIKAFQLAAANNDQVAAAVNERAMEEYTHMLIEARRESNHLRQELEAERNHCAQVCLKLKTSLQKRNNEFESAVVAKADEVVKERQAKISELEAALSQMKASEHRQLADRGVQAGDPAVTIPTQENFVPNVMSAVKREAPTRFNSNHSKEVFEQEVWRKTQELLEKFGSQK